MKVLGRVYMALATIVVAGVVVRAIQKAVVVGTAIGTIAYQAYKEDVAETEKVIFDWVGEPTIVGSTKIEEN